MKKNAVLFLLTIACLLAITSRTFAETRTVSWDPVTTYTDGTPIEAEKTVTYTAYWTTDAGLSIASLRTIGSSVPQTSTTFDPDLQGMTRGSTVYFTAKAVLNTGEESALSPAFSWTVPVVSVPAVLSSIAVGGPTSVNEGGTGTYTATATWDDGTTTSVTPSWSENSSYATISTGGVLTASAVTSNQTVTVSASYTSGGVTRTATRTVSIVDVPAVLSSIAVGGPTSVNEGGTGTYTATATWDDGTTTSVTPTWSENSSYATISTGGVLTASAVTSNQTVTVSASYTSGGVTRTATRTVSIVDVPSLAPAAPQNMGITGPISTVPTEVWRIAWEPVTTYADGTPLDPGRTVRYTAYWTDDPALSAGSLRQLASSISTTTFDFDPIARQMVKNQGAYLTVRAILDNGNQSSIAVAPVWVVANEGPVPPARGQITKQ